MKAGMPKLRRLVPALVAAAVALSPAGCGGDDDDAAAGAAASGAKAGRGGAGRGGRGGGGGKGGSATGGGVAGIESGGAGEPIGHAGDGSSGGPDNGQGGEGGAQATAFFGSVAGPLQGARVFLDRDGDFELDGDEPRATTDDEGHFTWPGVDAAEASRFQIVASVPASAVDSFTGEAVPHAFVLASPAGASPFVSPVSSLVAGVLGRYPGFTLEEAEASVRAKLGIDEAVSLFDDYVSDAASKSATASESAKLERAGRVLALSFGIDQTAIAALDDAAADAASVFSAVTYNAELQLGTVSTGIGGPTLDNGEAMAVAAFLKHIDATSFENRLDKSRRATRVDFFDTFADGAFIAFPGPNGGVLGYARIEPTSTDRDAFSLPQQDYAYDNLSSSYEPEPPIVDVGYALTRTGWRERTDTSDPPEFSSNADGSADQSSAFTRAAQRATSNAVDVSGRLIRSYAKGIDLVDRDERFGPGAVAYRLTVNATRDEYEAFDDDDQDNPVHPELPTLTDLDAVEAMYGPSGRSLRTLSGLNMRLLDDGSLSFTNGRDETALPLVGSWQRRTVEKNGLIELIVPPSYKAQFELADAATDLFLAVIDGQGFLGTVKRAGVTDTEDYYLLNQAAFDAVLAAAVANDDAVATFGQVAVDGTIEGATVFLDLNDNTVLDAGEPTSVSDSNGAYSLYWSERDTVAHSLVAVIPANALTHLPEQSDLYRVTQPFSLRAPPGTTLLTPYTTLIWYALETDAASDYAEAEAAIAAIVGTSGSLDTYVNASDADQEKVRLVAGTIAETLKEARSRILSRGRGVAAVVTNPDSFVVYKAIVGATYRTLAKTVAKVDEALANPTPPANLDSFVDGPDWSDVLEALAEGLFASFKEVFDSVDRAILGAVIDKVVEEVFGDSFFGWLFSPAISCFIKMKFFDLPCETPDLDPYDPWG